MEEIATMVPGRVPGIFTIFSADSAALSCGCTESNKDNVHTWPARSVIRYDGLGRTVRGERTANIRLRGCGYVRQKRYQPLKHERKPKGKVSAKGEKAQAAGHE